MLVAICSFNSLSLSLKFQTFTMHIKNLSTYGIIYSQITHKNYAHNRDGRVWRRVVRHFRTVKNQTKIPFNDIIMLCIFLIEPMTWRLFMSNDRQRIAVDVNIHELYPSFMIHQRITINISVRLELTRPMERWTGARSNSALYQRRQTNSQQTYNCCVKL